MAAFRIVLVLALSLGVASRASAQQGAQGAMIQGGAVSRGHAPVAIQAQGPGANVYGDGGTALDGNFTELGITNSGTPWCITDVPRTTAGGYHQLCLGANALGGGLLSYNNYNGAPLLPFNCVINGAEINNCLGGSAVVGASCPMIEVFGGGVAVADNVAAWNAALNAGNTCISFSKGTYHFLSGVSYSPSIASTGLALRGNGSSQTKLLFAAAGGITVNYFNKFNSVAFSGFSCLNGSTGGTCITLNRTTSDTLVSLDSNPSYLYDIVIGYAAPGEDWATCIAVNGVSNVNYNQVTCNNSPQVGYGGSVNGIVITGTSTNPSVVHNISASNFNWGNVGLTLNNYVEGVTVCCGSNFTVGSTGILVPSTGTNHYIQLTVTGSQFNDTNAVDAETEFFNIDFSHNEVLIPAGQIGLNLKALCFSSVIGNKINGNAGFSGTGIATTANCGAASPVNIISGNTFQSLATAILLNAGSLGNRVGLNSFNNNTTNIQNNGAMNVAGSNIIDDSVMGNQPAVASGGGDCGTSPFFGAGSNDGAGNLVVGSGANGNICTITFSQPFLRTPFCTAQDVTNPNVLAASQAATTTGFVIRGAVGITGVIPLQAGDHITYNCHGYQ